MNITIEDKRTILISLNLDLYDLHCKYCQNAVSHKDCVLLPGVIAGSNCTILCNSTRCLTDYLREIEKLPDKLLEHMALEMMVEQKPL